MDQLHYKKPNDQRFAWLRAVILPGPEAPGGAPTLKEIEQIENRLQLMKTGKAEYAGFEVIDSIQSTDILVPSVVDYKYFLRKKEK